MFRATALGVSAAFAGKIANAVPRRVRSRQPQPLAAKQAEATVTMIKGPHHPDDAKFWEEMKTDVRGRSPGYRPQPDILQLGNDGRGADRRVRRDAPADVVYLVDLVLAKFVNAGAGGRHHRVGRRCGLGD